LIEVKTGTRMRWQRGGEVRGKVKEGHTEALSTSDHERDEGLGHSDTNGRGEMRLTVESEGNKS
jgi:hypothetical protein